MFKVLIKHFTSISSNTQYETDVCIVGAGSIGMTMSHLLTKYKINHLILEKEKMSDNLYNHPKAHYIAPRTIETFKYVNLFSEKFFKDGANDDNNYFKNIDNWRHYRYCEHLLNQDSYYGEIDHLKDQTTSSEIDKFNSTLQEIYKLSNAYPMHLGQNKLNELLLYEKINKDKILFGLETKNFEYNEEEKVYYIHTNENVTIKSKIILGCDGSHSVVRRLLKIQNEGENNIQSFVNAHFTSLDLAKRLKSINKQSMLHFIFNPKFVCVLISYDMNIGQFVLQIPYFPGVENESDFTKIECVRILRELISSDNSNKFSVEVVKF